MSFIAPEGPVYQAGTLSGNPLATAAGLAALNVLSQKGIYEQLEEKSAFFFEKLNQLAQSKGIPFITARMGSMGSLFFPGMKSGIMKRFKRPLPISMPDFIGKCVPAGSIWPLRPLRPYSFLWPIPRMTWKKPWLRPTRYLSSSDNITVLFRTPFASRPFPNFSP